MKASLLLLFAVGLVTDVVETGRPTGWGSLVLQFGAFGLLAYMVIRQRPEEVRLEREERERRDANFIKALGELNSKHDERNERLVTEIRALRREP